MSSMAEARKWIRDHKLKSIGGLWATGLLGSLAYQYTRPIPTQLKIIHSRVYAQAVTLGALGLIAIVDLYDTRQQSDLHHQRLTALEQQQMEKAHASGHTHKT